MVGDKEKRRGEDQAGMKELTGSRGRPENRKERGGTRRFVHVSCARTTSARLRMERVGNGAEYRYEQTMYYKARKPMVRGTLHGSRSRQDGRWGQSGIMGCSAIHGTKGHGSMARLQGCMTCEYGVPVGTWIRPDQAGRWEGRGARWRGDALAQCSN